MRRPRPDGARERRFFQGRIDQLATFFARQHLPEIADAAGRSSIVVEGDSVEIQTVLPFEAIARAYGGAEALEASAKAGASFLMRALAEARTDTRVADQPK